MQSSIAIGYNLSRSADLMQHQDLSSSECDVRDEGGGADLDDCEIQEVVNTNKREESSEGVSNRSVQ